MPHFIIILYNASLLMLELIAFRSLPYIVYSTLSSKYNTRIRTFSLGVFLALIYFCVHHIDNFLGRYFFILFLYLYYFMVSSSVYFIRGYFIRGHIDNITLFICLIVIFLLIPAIVFGFLDNRSGLVVGMDLLLSAYSYCIDTKTAKKRSDYLDCVFFLLVDPTLVYMERGRQISHVKSSGRYIHRILFGMAVITVGLVGLHNPNLLLAYILPSAHQSNIYINIIVTCLGWVFFKYCSLSGLASFQIGYMKYLGYYVPECYRYPLLAKDPADFWRRWNIYIGSWFKRYVFYSLVFTFLRHKRMNLEYIKSYSLLITFFLVGLMHDIYSVVVDQSFNLNSAFAFTASAMAIIVWEVIRRTIIRQKRSGVSPQLAANIASRLFLVHSILFSFWIAFIS